LSLCVSRSGLIRAAGIRRVPTGSGWGTPCPRLPGAYVAAAGGHQKLAWMNGSTLEILVDSPVSNGQVLIMRSNTARGSGVPVHVHQREDEMFLLLDGALTVWAGDQRWELSSGGVRTYSRRLSLSKLRCAVP